MFKAEPIDQTCLNQEEIDKELITVPDWSYEVDENGVPSINREFMFDDFRNAFLFMSQS